MEETRKEKGMRLFTEGYNCAQAVVLAFEDKLSFSRETLTQMACSFGGGLGRLREVCGAVSGMALVLGLLFAPTDAEVPALKAQHYARVQAVAQAFEAKNGSIVCRELLGLDVKHDDPTPEARTAHYYKKRPCAELVGDAVEILDAYLRDNS